MLRLAAIAAWALAHPALYGYHLASLNGLQDAAVCAPMQAGIRLAEGSLADRDDPGGGLRIGMRAEGALHECISVTDAQFGFAVTIITLGGLCGSLCADGVIRRYGRKVTLRMAEVGLILGGVGVGLANEIWVLALGRLLIGTASGLIMVSIPPFLASLSHTHRKLLGTLHQICIGIGMIIAQSLSLIPALARRGGGWGMWRMEIAIAVVLAVGVFVVGWVSGVDADDERTVEERAGDGGGDAGPDDVQDRGGRVMGDDAEQRPLLGAGHRDEQLGRRAYGTGTEGRLRSPMNRPEGDGAVEAGPISRRNKRKVQDIGIREAFRGDVRYGAMVVVIGLCSQQITGISPVMFFSSKILKSTFGGDSKLVALTMMAIGIPFNFLPGLLKLESKPTLLISSAGTTIFALLLALGINIHSQILSGIAVLGFVIAFSFGLAPVVWVVLSEVVPPEARTAVGSVGVALNWGTNLALGSTFIPLQSLLGAEGNIFYFFAALSALAFAGIYGSYTVYERHLQEVDESD